MASESLHRLAAFTDTPEGGNPAGVWIGESLPPAGEMQKIAREVGYSETAFVAPSAGRRRTVRYYSPEAEVPFCGHATIATGVQLGHDDGVGQFCLDTTVGEIAVTVSEQGGHMQATLQSVVPRFETMPSTTLDELMTLFTIQERHMDTTIPAALAYAGAWHAVLPLNDRATLADMSYDFDALKTLMLSLDLTTVQLLYRESDTVFHVRNAFPVGGVVEDPATGASAAALGGYLRESGLIKVPVTLTLHQGVDMGRPSLITVDIPVTGGISVRGEAVSLEQQK